MSDGADNSLGVLITSDTHVSDAARLPGGLLSIAQRADHIIHAGDHSSADVLDVLGAFAPVTAVHGNVEHPEVFERLPETAFITLGGVRFGVVHIAGLEPGRHARLRQLLPDCDVRVYGHSHDPEIATANDGSLVVNPGSPTQRRRALHHTFVWAVIEGGECRAELVRLPPP